jgi:hypothetical protein
MNSAIGFRGVTLVGLRPPGVPPRKRQHTTPTGRGSTYQGRKPVQTKPATAMRMDGAQSLQVFSLARIDLIIPAQQRAIRLNP